jgi:hypothetical protein
MTYNSLVNEIQSYLQRVDATTIARIPTFITLAENKACLDIKNLGFEQYVNGTFIPGVNGGAVIQKPGRWRRTISFNFGTGEDNATRNVLRPMRYEFLLNYWPDRNLMGVPEYYADYGFSHWLIAPTPDDAYPFEIAYMELLEPLSVNVQTNWLTNYAPQVLLFGSLLQAQAFVRNMEMVPLWQQWYDQGVAGLNQQDAERINDRSTKADAD